MSYFRTRLALLLLLLMIKHGTSSADDVQHATINMLFDSFFQEIVVRNPEFATSLGLTPEMGYEFNRGALTDVSDVAADQEINIIQKYRQQLDHFDIEALSAKQRIAAKVFKIYLEQNIENEHFRHYTYRINPQFGVHYTLTKLLVDDHNNGFYRRLGVVCRKIGV